MAHFAKLDNENNVIAVHVINNDILSVNGVENEELGINFLTNLHNHNNWKQTSYNGNMRKNFAGIGFKYNPDLDAFIPPQPFPSWVLNEDLAIWQAPVPKPDESDEWLWDEKAISWVLPSQL